MSSLGSEDVLTQYVSGWESVWSCAPPGLHSEWQLMGLRRSLEGHQWGRHVCSHPIHVLSVCFQQAFEELLISPFLYL